MELSKIVEIRSEQGIARGEVFRRTVEYVDGKEVECVTVSYLNTHAIVPSIFRKVDGEWVGECGSTLHPIVPFGGDPILSAPASNPQ